MLEIKNLCVKVENRLILKNINLSIAKGDVMVLFGPNGSGKSTLIKAVMGFEGYNVTKGEIVLNGKKVNGFSIDERAKLGAGIMFQHPPKVRGVRLAQISEYLCGDNKKIERLAKELSLKEHLERDINSGFSGGEMKRSELFQLALQDPDLLLLDEPESGVDIENISIMGEVLNCYLADKRKSALIITHTGYILDYINAKSGCLLIDGELWCSGRSPKNMFEEIKKEGYEHCRECHGKN
ncbi:MAG: ATP-binding cassette domain-containing protein [Candidatus Omnitrophota bacterium]